MSPFGVSPSGTEKLKNLRDVVRSPSPSPDESITTMVLAGHNASHHAADTESLLQQASSIGGDSLNPISER